ncbi:MAG: hypothetical protein JW884_09615 [Deltaproteobacteria bacterium]|nr:hypothetical protein [Deltaproteobacteria bacterium]
MTTKSKERFEIDLLRDRRRFLTLIINRFEHIPSDFSERYRWIGEHAEWRAAGVLIPLFFRHTDTEREEQGEFVFKLIKRSSRVPQGGDIGGPGGMIEPLQDGRRAHLIAWGIPPVLWGRPRKTVRKQGREAFRHFLLFAAAALRESKEEVNLGPLNIRLLGALPTYSLRLFTRTIFPLVGYIRHPWAAVPNDEVEKIVDVPLSLFCDPSNYGMLRLAGEGDARNESPGFPCLLFSDKGTEEILWGATFTIIRSFFTNVLQQDPVPETPLTIAERTLPRNYLTGDNS